MKLMTRAEIERVANDVVDCIELVELKDLMSTLLQKEYWVNPDLFIKHHGLCSEEQG